MMNKQFNMHIKDALATLPGTDPVNRDYEILFSHGTAELIVYAPRGTDDQEIHDRDEFYFIISGCGKFFDGEKTIPIRPGCVLFVAAGVKHYFVDFSDDLSMWVLFYGPIGGEAPAVDSFEKNG